MPNITTNFITLGLKFYSLILRRPPDWLISSGENTHLGSRLDLNGPIGFGCILYFRPVRSANSQKCAGGHGTLFWVTRHFPELDKSAFG